MSGGVIEDLAEGHEQDHKHDDGDDESGRYVAAAGGGTFAGGVLEPGGEGVSGELGM